MIVQNNIAIISKGKCCIMLKFELNNKKYYLKKKRIEIKNLISTDYTYALDSLNDKELAEKLY